MRVKGLISMLTRVLKKHGNVRVDTWARRHNEKPRSKWIHSNGAIYKWREDKEDMLLI